MKNKWKQLVALIMTLSMITGLLPTNVTAAEIKEIESQSTRQDVSDVTMEGSDSVETLLSDRLSEAEEESSKLEKQNEYISGLVISGNQAGGNDGNGKSISSMYLYSASGSLDASSIEFSSTIYLRGGMSAGNDEWADIVNSISWSISDTSVVDNITCKWIESLEEKSYMALILEVTPKGAGTATITGTLPDGKKVSCTATVNTLDTNGISAEFAVSRNASGDEHTGTVSTFGTQNYVYASDSTVYNKQPHTISRLYYDNWSNLVSGNIIKTSNGYMIISALYYFEPNGYDIKARDVLIQYYSNSFELQSEKVINCELEYFGGFYESADYYYLVFGHDNLMEDDSQEVMRLVRYDKQWNRLVSASLYGADTYQIFYAGSLRIAEDNKFIYVHTCHTMYADKKGIHHQSNLTMMVNKNDMNEVRWGGPYVSHSFNQFIMTDDEGAVIALDHGDAYPRGLVLSKRLVLNSQYEEGWLSSSRVMVKSFNGEIGENRTGVTVGGLEYSSSNYLTVYSSIEHDENWRSNTARNVYVTATPINNFSEESTITTKITNYTEGSNVIVGTPVLVKMSTDAFLLMWEEKEYDDDTVTARDRLGTGTICYIILDGEGKANSSIKKISGYLSDCQPIYVDNEVIWYTAQAGKVIFYSINLTTGKLITYNMTSVVNSVEKHEKGVRIKWTKDPKAIRYQILRLRCEGYGSSYIYGYNTKVSAFSKWDKIAETTSTEYTDKSAESDTFYYYTVRAVYKDSNGKEYTPTCYDIEGETWYYLEQPKGNNSNTSSKKDSVKKGTVVTVNNIKYKVTSLYSIGGGEVKIIGYTNKLKNAVKIPSTIKINGSTYAVVSIEDKAFKNNKKITKISITDRIYSIGKYAFQNCKKLKRVNLYSHGTTKIGAYAFKGCKKLTTLNVKSDLFTKKGLKNSLKGSSIKIIKLHKSIKHKKNSYKEIFAKKNCGKKVTVK